MVLVGDNNSTNRPVEHTPQYGPDGSQLPTSQTDLPPVSNQPGSKDAARPQKSGNSPVRPLFSLKPRTQQTSEITPALPPQPESSPQHFLRSSPLSGGIDTPTRTPTSQVRTDPLNAPTTQTRQSETPAQLPAQWAFPSGNGNVTEQTTNRAPFQSGQRNAFPQPTTYTLPRPERFSTLPPSGFQFKNPRLLAVGPELKVDLDDPFDVGSIPNDLDDEDGIDKRPTIPMMVLAGLSQQQGQAAPKMQSEISGAASGAAIVGIGSIMANIFKYASNLIVVRGFGVGASGLYGIATALVSLFVSVCNLGLDDAMVRYVAMYNKKQQPGLIRGLTIFCTMLSVVSGLIGAVIAMFIALSIADKQAVAGDKQTLFVLLMMEALFIPLTCVQGVMSTGLQGFKAFKWRVISQRFIVPIILIVGMIVALIVHADIKGAVIADFISDTVGSVLCMYFYYKLVRAIRIFEPIQYQIKEWLGFAIPNLLTSVIDTIFEAVDTLLLTFFSVGSIQIAQYLQGNKISVFISQPLLTLNVMFAPTIADLHTMGEREKLSIMFKIVTKWTITLSMPIFLIAVIFAQPLLGIAGDGVTGGWPYLVALSVGNIVNSATGSVGYMLTMTGHQRWVFINSLVAMVINLALGLILTPMKGPLGGAMGVAIATGFALAALNIMRLLQVWFLLKIHPYKWDTLKPIGAGLFSALVTWGILSVIHNLHWALTLLGHKYSVDLGVAPIFLALYTGLIILFRFSEEDRIVLDTLGQKLKLKRGKKKKKK